MKNHILVTIITLFVCSSYAIEDCGSEVGQLIEISVTGCEDLTQRCTLHRNTNVTLTMKFQTSIDVQNVTSVVYGVILGVPVPFVLSNPDACVNCGLSCPLAAGGPYTYIAVMPVEKKYPKVTVDVKWELQNENKKNILCVLIPSKIQ